MKGVDLFSEMLKLRQYIDVIKKAKKRIKDSNDNNDEILILSEIEQVFFKKLLELENTEIEIKKSLFYQERKHD